MSAATNSRSRNVRSYHTVRTAHLERSLELEPADLIYGQRRYDFDQTVAEAVSSRAGLEQAGGLHMMWLLAHRGYEVVEINEPIALETVRRTALALVAIRVSDLVRRRRTSVVTYAIGNVPVSQLPRPGGKARLGRLLDERLAPLVWRRCDRVAFGTGAAETAYAQSFGAAGDQTAITTVPALPTACNCPTPSLVETSGRSTSRVLFLGDLSVRKGFDLVMDAWSEVRDALPAAQLVIVGRGSLAEQARLLAAADDRVSFFEDPPREVVHQQLRLAALVVLPSQPTRSWREQVGLPLVEALAHGCTVVTTDETGIAGWLSAHGHHTIPAREAATQLSPTLVGALRHVLDPEEVIASLPLRDGRLSADAWLLQSSR